ncbi:MAG: hypothetical protein INQ03_16250 [Candidatus Heimdallarchaeota archaeon]|nr:hypothetical protein [Candidatus Heimdallarchaeota archaeon]
MTETLAGNYEATDDKYKYRLYLAKANEKNIFGHYFSYSKIQEDEEGGMQRVLSGNFKIMNNEITFNATKTMQESWIIRNGEEIAEGEAMTEPVEKTYTGIIDFDRPSITLNMRKRTLVFIPTQ